MIAGLRVGLQVGVRPGVGASDSNHLIVLIVGQSNASGRGDYHALTDQTLITAYPNIKLKQQLAATNDGPLTWTFYATDSLQPRTDNPTLNMGTELTLGRYMDAVRTQGFAIAKMGVGSANLNVNWKVSGTYPASQDNLFTQARKFAQNAQGELGGRIAGIVWIQGETDATDPTMAAAYQQNMIDLLAGFRSFFPAVPFVFNRLSNSTTGTEKATIRTAQTNFAADVASTKVTMVDCDALALQGDNIHFTADSYASLGNTFALELLKLLGINVPPIAAFSSSVVGFDVTFTDASTDPDGSVASRLWNFGDGQTSTATNPVHTYASGATYTVSLTVTDNVGGTNTVSHPVIVVNQTWEADATSSKGVPATAQHWLDFSNNYALSIGAASGILGFQEASGAVVDLVNGLSFAASGTGLAYAQALASWTRKAITTTDGGTGRFLSTDTSLPDISTTSFLVLLYVAVTAAPAAARGIMGLGGSSSSTDAEVRTTTTPAWRSTSGTNTATSAVALGTSVHPIMLKVDRTASTVVLYTDSDTPATLTPTFAAGMTAKRLAFGQTLGASTAATALTYGAWWTGANAEITLAQARTMLQGLGWTISW